MAANGSEGTAGVAANGSEGTAGVAANGSEGTAGVAAASSSLSVAHEGSLARQYSALRISGREAEGKEMEGIVARFASLRNREERLAAIAADLREMEAQRRAAGVAPSDAEVAAFVILRESADAALEGLPGYFAPIV